MLLRWRQSTIRLATSDTTTLESDTIRKIEITAMNNPKQASPTGQARPRNIPKPVATALPPFQPSHTGQM